METFKISLWQQVLREEYKLKYQVAQKEEPRVKFANQREQIFYNLDLTLKFSNRVLIV